MASGGNTYDKYASSNPIERRLVAGFLDAVEDLALRSGVHAAHEIGCGEGEIATRLAAAGLDVRGSDISGDVIDEARRRASERGLEIPFRAAAIDELTAPGDSAELIVCCEVLEHLQDPDAGLARIAELARPWALLSVPREPLWRALNLARGAYVGSLGNTPGHRSHFSASGFRRFLGRRLEVVEMRRPPPWSVALCRTR